MKMRSNFHKFFVNSRTIDIKFGGIGAIFMGLQPIHQLSKPMDAYSIYVSVGVTPGAA